MPFYIHIDDPGFPDPPWPGQRRFGPYNTVEEALAQAAADAAQGMGVAVGIYDEENSDLLADPPTDEQVEQSRAVLRNGDDVDPFIVERSRDVVARRAGVRAAKAMYPRSEIKRRGEVEFRRRAKVEALEHASEEERDKALDAILASTGMTAKDLRAQGVIR